MRKSLLTVVGILLAISALAQDESESANDDVLETWHCFGIYDLGMKKVIVSLTRFKARKGNYTRGKVEVADVIHDAVFEVAGFNRRWSFSSGEVQYAFVIEPDGSGNYYDFSGPRNDYGVESSQSYECKLV